MPRDFTDDFLEVWIYKHLAELDDVQYNLYLENRNRGLNHQEALIRIYNYDRWCKTCDTIVSVDEYELSTCDKCCAEMVRNF